VQRACHSASSSRSAHFVDRRAAGVVENSKGTARVASPNRVPMHRRLQLGGARVCVSSLSWPPEQNPDAGVYSCRNRDAILDPESRGSAAVTPPPFEKQNQPSARRRCKRSWFSRKSTRERFIMLRCVRRIALSALFLAICLPAACSGQSGGGGGGYRTFTDSRGRTVQARVLDVDGDEVTIERRDGKSFTLAISAFSQADQDFLRQPAQSAPAAATEHPVRSRSAIASISPATPAISFPRNRAAAWSSFNGT